jgi:hypothetical protein
MPCLWQARSKGWRRQVAVGPERFFGKSANWMPLSVRTTLILYGIASISSSKNVTAVAVLALARSRANATSGHARIRKMLHPATPHTENVENHGKTGCSTLKISQPQAAKKGEEHERC